MAGYFARLAQRSDIAPAVIASRAPAAFAHTDGDALDQNTEVIVTPPDETAVTPPGEVAVTPPDEIAVTASGPTSIASPPARAKTVASSSSALPDPSPATDADMPLSPSAPAPQASVQRAPRIVSTAAAHPASPEAVRSASAEDDAEPAPTYGGGDQAQPVSSVSAVTSLHKEIPATSHASAGSVARFHGMPAQVRPGEHDDPPSLRDATATSSSAIPGAGDASLTRPPSRAMPILHSDTQSTQPAATAARAQLQVHIGRIELEVHQPPPAIAPPPAAPPPAQPVDRAGRSASFNPHRHYLRGFW